MRFFTSTGPSRNGVQRYRKAIPFTTVVPALDLPHVRDRARQRRSDHGGSLGIGLALAERFIAEGMRVVLADIDAPKLRDVEARLTEAGAEVATTICDTTSEAAVAELAEFTLERFGAAHVLCNNAGILGFGDAWRDPMELWERVIGVNLYGVIHGIRSFLPIMEQQGARPHRQHRLDGGSHRAAGRRAVQRDQARGGGAQRGPVHRVGGARARPSRSACCAPGS